MTIINNSQNAWKCELEILLLHSRYIHNANKAKINGKSNEGNCADSQCDSDTGSHGER
jgi:hypothetical protein